VTDVTAVQIDCADGLRLGGHLWRHDGDSADAVVVINAATGVLSRYYHRYALFLAEQGFDVITYDYRGIGASRPSDLRGCHYRWSDWGTLDCDAALELARAQAGSRPVLLVGHSFGGFLPGLAANGSAVSRLLTVGAHFAWWRDYRRGSRLRLFLKWHVAMPVLTALCGYFPGRRLGWLEDLPAGVANEWSFRRRHMELSFPAASRAAILQRFKDVTAPILAVSVTDDDLAPAAAVGRGLTYYASSRRDLVVLTPADLGVERIGHMGLFHARHRQGFWRDTVTWLRGGVNPWPEARQSVPLEAVR
jgi:predicted alpha/beta hydrolase